MTLKVTANTASSKNENAAVSMRRGSIRAVNDSIKEVITEKEQKLREFTKRVMQDREKLTGKWE